jgi:hypothetical protein
LFGFAFFVSVDLMATQEPVSKAPQGALVATREPPA